MLNLKKIYFCFFTIFLLLAPYQINAQGLEPISAEQDPFTVSDVIVDKTDINAVTARDKAIAEARRAAFAKLAQKAMSRTVFMEYKMPQDDVIAALVKDFEIKDEKISAKRYVANFTVRFNKEAAHFIRMGGGTIQDYDPRGEKRLKLTPQQRDFIAWDANAEITVLVLPYYKNFYGRNLLWEDPNPWREAWQSFGRIKTAAGASIVTPLGDIDDISQGSAEAVWNGNYGVLDKLKEKYNSNEVVVTVADVKDGMISIAIYSYINGDFKYKKSIKPYEASGEVNVGFWQLIRQLVADKSFFEGVISSKTDKQYLKEDRQIKLEITMNFANFKEWLAVQKAMSSIAEPPAIKISSLNRNSVNFNIDLKSEEAFERLKTSFFQKGLFLVPIDYSAPANYDIDVYRYFLRFE